MTTIAEFEVAYDGEALKSNAMDVRSLAPALLAFGKLFDEANRVVNGSNSSVSLKVKATTTGSFDILFQLDQSLVSQVKEFLTGDVVTSAINLKEIIIGTGVTLFFIIRKLRGKKPDRIKDLKNGMVEVQFEGESFIVPLELMRLYQDIGVRKATQEVLAPLTHPGIDVLYIYNEQHVVIETVRKEDVEYYATPEIEDEMILENEHQAAYTIVSLAFKEDNKWRLHDGSSTISVKMSDDDFKYKVDNSLISFAKGDILICKIKATQYRTDVGLKTEYDVLRVIDHKSGMRQLLLPFDND